MLKSSLPPLLLTEKNGSSNLQTPTTTPTPTPTSTTIQRRQIQIQQMQIQEKTENEDDYCTPRQSPKTNICTPCKRIRLDPIPVLELPPPFLHLETSSSSYYYSSSSFFITF